MNTIYLACRSCGMLMYPVGTSRRCVDEETADPAGFLARRQVVHLSARLMVGDEPDDRAKILS